MCEEKMANKVILWRRTYKAAIITNPKEEEVVLKEIFEALNEVDYFQYLYIENVREFEEDIEKTKRMKVKLEKNPDFTKCLTEDMLDTIQYEISNLWKSEEQLEKNKQKQKIFYKALEEDDIDSMRTLLYNEGWGIIEYFYMYDLVEPNELTH